MADPNGTVPPDGRIPGHIAGIRLTRRTWRALKQDDIRTLHQLAAIADRIERTVPGIGRRSAGMIRKEVARALPRNRHVIGDGLSPFGVPADRSGERHDASAPGMDPGPTVATLPSMGRPACGTMSLGFVMSLQPAPLPWGIPTADPFARMSRQAP